ncbi:MAG TPA: MMPL family transporter [Gaiellaceae bacterium]|nr:MMPL family transporter [Gaiellaceae bacterium]
MPERWTRAVLRFRVPILLCWLAVLGVGVVASIRLPALLSNTFTVPGTDSDRARVLLADAFGERPDGVFTVVFRVAHPSDRAVRRRLQHELDQAAALVPTGSAGSLQAGGGILFGNVDTTLDLQHAKTYTTALRRALPGALVTGQPAIQHDLEPVLRVDLRRGEAIALPIALLVLVAVLGLCAAVLVPFVFAACTITLTLTVLYVIAQHFSMVSYVTNLVELIGLGLAVDYSLLIVSRFREELGRTEATDDAIVRTMETAGRAVVFSGGTVAIGLALLLLVPVPFIRSLGIGGFLVPLASIAAAATLQPALLSIAGRRGVRRVPVAAYLRRIGITLPVLPGTIDVESGFWARLARSIMRRPVAYLTVGTAILVAAAVPAAFLRVTPGSISALPQFPESVRGLALLRDRAGAGTLTPTEIVVDAGAPGRVRSRPVHAAIERLGDELFHDPEVSVVALGRASPYVARGGRYARVIVIGRHEYGDERSQALVRRIRDTLVPAARFPAGIRVLAGGAPPQGVDYLSVSYGAFPWLVLAVLALTYVVLLRAFRSLVLPLKAVVLNVLTVAAVYGILVVVFRWGVGASLFGLYRVPQIEGWIPIFLFAVLFGLSMDYEVFLVSRMREEWDRHHDNHRAVAHGLERTGRIITAAALIMVAAFMGFVGGRIAGLQEFGVGLAIAVLLDATIVRCVLVPSLMTVLDRYNWWLPVRIARLARVQASPLVEEGRAGRPSSESEATT